MYPQDQALNGQQPRAYQFLCQICEDLVNSSIEAEQEQRYLVDFEKTKISASQGCHFCTLVLEQLESRDNGDEQKMKQRFPLRWAWSGASPRLDVYIITRFKQRILLLRCVPPQCKCFNDEKIPS